MNALLVYPEFPNTFWSYKHALKFIRKKAAFPPLVLLSASTMTHPEFFNAISISFRTAGL
jgi:hypothetical protein